MKQKFYSLAFILYLLFSFIGQFFILNRVFGEGVGTVLIGMLLFPLGIWNSFFYFLFLPTEMARKPQIYRFSILFLPVLYLVFSLLGGGPSAFMLGLIAFPSNAVVYAVSTGIKSMITDFWPLFACLKKELKMDLSNDTSVSRLKRKSAIIEREFEKGE